MGTKLTKKAKEAFEGIKKTDENGHEWWSSRDLARVLTYTDYRNFLEVMRKAWKACANSGEDPSHHFVRVTEMIQLGKGAEREVETWLMSRYVCYLAVQNADPAKRREHVWTRRVAARRRLSQGASRQESPRVKSEE